jgi:hypothetical protein
MSGYYLKSGQPVVGRHMICVTGSIVKKLQINLIPAWRLCELGTIGTLAPFNVGYCIVVADEA